jgi:hypothetical protein
MTGDVAAIANNRNAHTCALVQVANPPPQAVTEYLADVDFLCDTGTR